MRGHVWRRRFHCQVKRNSSNDQYLLDEQLYAVHNGTYCVANINQPIYNIKENENRSLQFQTKYMCICTFLSLCSLQCEYNIHIRTHSAKLLWISLSLCLSVSLSLSVCLSLSLSLCLSFSLSFSLSLSLCLSVCLSLSHSFSLSLSLSLFLSPHSLFSDGY